MWKSFKAAADVISEEEISKNPLYKKGLLFEEENKMDEN